MSIHLGQAIKRTPIEEYKIQARGGKGLLTYDKDKLSKTGELVGALVVKQEDEIMLINSDGVIIRFKVSDVSSLNRATQGVKLMRVDEETNIISIARVLSEDTEDDLLDDEMMDEDNQDMLDDNEE